MDPIMGVSSLHCCLAVLLHSFFVLTHPCAVPDFCFLLYCFSFSSCGCLSCDTLCCVFKVKEKKQTDTQFLHCTIFDILLLRGLILWENITSAIVVLILIHAGICKKNPPYLSWALMKECEVIDQKQERTVSAPHPTMALSSHCLFA